MAEISLIEIGKSLEGFEVVYPKENPWGLSTELLKNLWDIVINKGWSSSSRSLIYKTDNLLIEIIVNPIKEYILMKISRPGTLPMYQSHRLKNNVALFWNDSLYPEEVEKEIDLIKEFNQLSQKKIKVDDFFQSKDKFLIVAPETDIKEVLNEFDQPDLLSVVCIRQKSSYRIICLRSEIENIKGILSIKLSNLQKTGLTSKDFIQLSDEEFFNLLAKEI